MSQKKLILQVDNYAGTMQEQRIQNLIFLRLRESFGGKILFKENFN